MITIKGVKLPELRSLLDQLQTSSQAQITGTSMTSGTITAHHFLIPTLHASYSLDENGNLTVEANEFEGQIAAELQKRIMALQAQGV